jgi:FtsZ-binding cell division protein ZapB
MSEVAAAESSSAPEASEAPSTGESTNDYVEAETLPLFDEVRGEDLHGVKVNGVEKEIPYDKLVEGYQKGEAADEKFREVSATKKENTTLRTENETLKSNFQTLQANVQALVEKLKTDPMSIVGHKSLGHNVNELVENAYNQQLEYEELDPLERENIEIRKQLEQIQKEKQRKAQEQEHAQRVAGSDRYKTGITEKLNEAGITPTANNLRIATQHLRNSCDNNGNVTITWRQMADQTKETLRNEARQTYGNYTPEQLSELFGEDVINNIRKQSVEKVKNNFHLRQPKPGAIPIKNEAPTSISTADWRERMNKLKNSL